MIVDLLARRAEERPRDVFLRTEAGERTFAEVLEAAGRFAGLLVRHGVRCGDHVAVLADNGAPYVVALLGASWLGAVVVALNNELIADGLRYSLAQSDAKLIVADARWMAGKRRFLDGALEAIPVVELRQEGEFFRELEGEPEAPRERRADSETALILYTSGTTGLPKGVMISHGCLAAVGRDTAAALNLAPADRIMVFLPLFHTNPQMYALMSALTVGCSLIVRPRFSAGAFFEDAKRFGATGFTFVGTVLSILAVRHQGERRDHALRFAIGGGSPPDVWRSVHERFGVRIHELYGMTEIGGWVSCNTVADYRFGSCGRIRRSMDVRIFDADDRELGPGEAGEIVVRPREPNVILSGYYRKPEALAEASRNFWFHTGDRGAIDADGYLWFHGRTKELIRRAGEMISPVEIETKLRAMAGVDDCAAVGVPDDIQGEEIKVAVVSASGLRPEAIAQFLGERVPGHMVPRYVEFVERIPRTETEKVQRGKLQYLGDSVHDLRRPA